MKIAREETLQARLERSDAMRSNIKKFYIYVVLVLIILVFSLARLLLPAADGRTLAIRRGSVPDRKVGEIYLHLDVDPEPMTPIRTWL